MTISAADLDNLETNIKAADDWVGGGSETDGVAANGRTIKSITKINAEAQVSFDNQLSNFGFEPPILFASGINVNRNTLTVEESTNIFAPLVSEIPFTTTGTFNAAQWYIITDFLPAQATNKNKVLTTDGTTAEWSDTVVDITFPTLTGFLSETTSPSINDIVEFKGFGTSGDAGGAKWKHNGNTGQPISQSPAQLVDSLLNDASGNQWELVSDIINVKHLGAINSTTIANDSTLAFAAVAAACLRTGKSWRANGDFYVEKADMFTSGEGDCILHSINAGQSTGVLNILPDPTDETSEDPADINALLPLTKGTSKIAALGVHAGKFIRAASVDRYLNRQGSATDYRFELQFIVLNAAGDIYPPLPFDVPNTVTFTVFDTEVLRKTITTPNIRTVLDTFSGSVGREAHVINTRSLVSVNFTVENTTTLEVLQGYKGAGYKNTLNDCDVVKNLVVATNFGYNFTGCGHELRNCSERGCRRGFDGSFLNSVNIIGGNYPDGIGAHLGFNINGSDILDIGYSSANINPLHFTGGDIKFTRCKIRVLTGAIFEARTDAPEVIGSVVLDNCELVFDWTDETGAKVGVIYSFALPASSFDGGRDIVLPDNIQIINNKITVLGAGHTGHVEIVNMFDTGSTSRNVIANTTVDISGNEYNFVDVTKDVRMVANKQSYITGSGVTFNYRDLQKLNSVFFGNVANTIVAPFITFFARDAESVTLSADYGWLKRSIARNAVYSAATGTPLYESSSFWGRLTDSGKISVEYSIADDAVILIDNPGLYFTIELFQLNQASRFAKYNADTDGAGELSEMYGSNIVNLAPTVLTGTTGTDGNVSISNDGTSTYLENRRGGNTTLSVIIDDSTI